MFKNINNILIIIILFIVFPFIIYIGIETGNISLDIPVKNEDNLINNNELDYVIE